ncbi:MAG TPA: rhomboid family intramembrane serine protease [Kofleriaceae bacterium]|nr:rhomboid family intramembrane serine protease [Kofleriaceae bacterium]
MPLFDFALVTAIVVTAYLGPMILRRMGPGQRMYGWMLVGDLVLAVIALASRKGDVPDATGDLLGTVAIGGAVCLVFVPPLLRNLARRALIADRLSLARWMVDLRELLQPGMGARQESELIATIIEVRSGQVDAAVGRLRERRDRIVEPMARRPVDERIIMTYLYARRWDDAALWFESNLLGQGMSPSPQLSVEMVRAYCERGQLERAASLVTDLEHSAGTEEPIWTLLLSRARLVFLAFLGRISAVEAILAPSGPLGSMPEASRLFWSGLARLKAGDVTGARSSLERAAALSGRDGRARELAEATLSRIDEPGIAGPLDVPPPVAELADRLSRLAEDAPASPPTSTAAIAVQGGMAAVTARSRATRPPRLSGVAAREVPVTTALIALNLAAAIAVYAIWRVTSDIGALIQAGANMKVLTERGEWWRLVSCTFLHVGILHLLLNMYGLWVLGRLVEQFIGSARMLAVYMLAGLAGSAASMLFGGPGTSAGASGAVFGLLGAAVAELALHRAAYPRRWSGALLGNLVFLAGANVVIGLMYPVIDQSAHLGGLVVGALAGAALSRKVRWARALVTRIALVVVLALSAAAVVYAGYGLATSDLASALAELPRVTAKVGGVLVDVPENWEPASPNQIDDRSLPVLMVIEHKPGVFDADAAVAEQLEVERSRGLKEIGLEHPRLVKDVLLDVPAPWRAAEIEAVSEDGIAGTQRFRATILARPVPGGLLMSTILYPASLAGPVSPTIAGVLRSARLP